MIRGATQLRRAKRLALEIGTNDTYCGFNSVIPIGKLDSADWGPDYRLNALMVREAAPILIVSFETNAKPFDAEALFVTFGALNMEATQLRAPWAGSGANFYQVPVSATIYQTMYPRVGERIPVWIALAPE